MDQKNNSVSADNFLSQRLEMVKTQIRRRGIRDERVLRAMEVVPRHLFVPTAYRTSAYEDCALPIEENQTISQPYIVAAMTEALALTGNEHVLEIGTGSGYQTAILAELARDVISVETKTALAQEARRLFRAMGLANIQIHEGDGSQGWPAAAPYDAILVTAASPSIPQPLIDELDARTGRLVIPVGDQEQQE